MIVKDPRNIIRYFSGRINLPAYIRRTGQKLIFPFYHAVSDSPGSHMRHLYPIKSRREFIEDLDALLRYFTPVSPDKLLTPSFKPERPGFVLSFDDGLKEVREIISPILKEKGIPAIFFLNNNFIDNKDLFYRYKVSLLIDKAYGDGDFMPGKAGHILERKIASLGDFHRAVLNLKFRDSERIDELCRLFEVDIAGFLKAHKPYMAENDVFELKSGGFHIGAHSFEHPDFMYMEPAKQSEEILGSSRDIRERFGLSYSFFAFPFTDYGVDEKVMHSIHSMEDFYPGATFGTAGMKPHTGIPHYQRISMEKYDGNSKRIIQTEYLYTRLKQAVGKF